MNGVSSRAHAGAYAQQRFLRGRARWRARIGWVAAACLGPFILGGLVVPFLYPRPLPIWMAGMVAGAAASAWALLADSPPAHVENWRTGAEAERKTARCLRALDHEQWLVVHDVDAERGNYDHIVVGSAGVFLLDTKWPSGTMRIEHGTPWVTRREDPEAQVRYPRLAPSVKAAAARLSHELGRRCGRGVWVDPLLVVWCEFPAGVHAEDGYAFVHGSRVAEWLEAQPARLDEARVATLGACLQELVDGRGADQLVRT